MGERAGILCNGFQLTAARRRLAKKIAEALGRNDFNSQPREGGWLYLRNAKQPIGDFNSQPREGGWKVLRPSIYSDKISTHSRAKAAGLQLLR